MAQYLKTVEVPVIKYRLSDIAHIRCIHWSGCELIFDIVMLSVRLNEYRNYLSLNDKMYIANEDGTDKLYLLRADSIPVSPSAIYSRFFPEPILMKLYFPLPPKSVNFIDLIEHEGEYSGAINFYGICLNNDLTGTFKPRWDIVCSIKQVRGDNFFKSTEY